MRLPVSPANGVRALLCVAGCFRPPAGTLARYGKKLSPNIMKPAGDAAQLRRYGA